MTASPLSTVEAFAEGLRANAYLAGIAAEEVARAAEEIGRMLRISRAARRIVWRALPWHRRLFVSRP